MIEFINENNICNYLNLFYDIVEEKDVKEKIKRKLKQWKNNAYKRKQNVNMYVYEKYYN